MANITLIAAAKLALRITTSAYDDEIGRLLDAAFLDLGVAGVDEPSESDALYEQAAITYVRANFGSPSDYDRLKKSYDEQKAQMQTATGYTNWGS